MSEGLVLHPGPRAGSETFPRLASMSLRSTSEAAMSAVSLRGVERHFGVVRAVAGAGLDIRPGGVFAIRGPSGSGKTPCLRLIGGFDQPTAGRIEIFGEAVEGVPVYRRPVNTVFQDYALFPLMNVLENVCYGLMVRRMDRAERHRLGLEALKLVKLVGLEARKPGELSGGQRQRVALARALVLRPKVLLLDEPLGALDLKLREAMQSELKSLQRSLGLTFVFVTHDQGEALSMADRVAVFNHGRVVQIGTPEEIYERPLTRFVADFVGGSNVIEAGPVNAWTGGQRAASVRPEKIALIGSDTPARADCVVLDGRIAQVLYHGAVSRIELVTAEAGRLFLTIPSTVAPPQQGVAARISFSRDAVHFMEPE